MIRLILPFALLWSATPVVALEFYEERGGWSIVAADSVCAMSMEYEGPGESTVMYLKDTDGTSFLSVTNYNWSSSKDETYDVRFVLNGNAYGGAPNPGFESRGKRGFLAKMSGSFENDFAAGKSLHLYLGDKIIDRLSLTGTAVGVASLKRCIGLLRREQAAEARERARWADLPEDPFAGSATPQTNPLIARQPRPRGNPGAWANLNDYPSAALREQREGVSRFRLSIASDGVVQSCETTTSSGSPDLDAATCTLMMRRARFEPAKDSSGNNVEGTWESAVRWEIPVSSLPSPPPIRCVPGEVCKRD